MAGNDSGEKYSRFSFECSHLLLFIHHVYEEITFIKKEHTLSSADILVLLENFQNHVLKKKFSSHLNDTAKKKKSLIQQVCRIIRDGKFQRNYNNNKTHTL